MIDLFGLSIITARFIQAITCKDISLHFQNNSVPTLCDPMNRSMPGLPVHHQLPEFTQTHVHEVGDAIQPSHPLSSPFPPAPNPSRHQGLFQSVKSSHEVAKYWSFSLSISPSNEPPGLVPLGWTGWISLQSRGLSRVFFNTTVQKFNQNESNRCVTLLFSD